MGGIFSIIAIPFGYVLKWCYMLVQNYGWALLLFTVLIKLLLLPSSAKTQISTAKMAKIQPKLEQLKKKYANNQQKLNEATAELYSQENVNPMGSCLPMVITMVLLFAIIDVVYAPLTYLAPKGVDIESAKNAVNDYYLVSTEIKNNADADGNTVLDNAEVSKTDLYEALLAYKNAEDSKIADFSDDKLETIAAVIVDYNYTDIDDYFTNDNEFSSRLISTGAKTRGAELLVLSVSEDYPELFSDEMQIVCADIDYTFLGAKLGMLPSWTNIYILIPILSLISQLAVTLVSQHYQKKSAKGNASPKGMTTMLYVMPLFSFFIAFSFPAGIGIYWIFSSVLAVAQTVFLNLYYTPARIEKIIEKEAKKARKKPSLYQTMLEKQKEQLAGTISNETNEEVLTEDIKLSRSEKKEAERNALNEARRRYAEKYGDKLD